MGAGTPLHAHNRWGHVLPWYMPDGNWIGTRGVSDGACLVNVLARQAYVGRGDGFNVPFRNLEIATAAMRGDLTSVLRRVVLIGQKHLRAGFDQQSVGLGA
ncbi:hypothetical protein D3218_19150 [Aureimonas flava]|uniref:Uncharacterized protein n=1 Tax=Aureimonas flava TaxID=2320271 RepID=A0A3A1WME8_9HYPH|nr:hypothetical protein [Aureimonas flava]RIX97179.1 hypothetical protein D3218_19150 [Aureimonas flava]